MAEPRSNSMNFAPVRDVSRARDERCPLAAEPARLKELGDVERMVFVRLRDRMRLCRTDTRDFSSPEIARVKSAQQIYLDVSSKLAPDDFSRDLKKLELEAECRHCPEAHACAGCYRASAYDVFAGDEGRVREIVGSLEGDVLDVGAGLAPYASELSEAAHAKKTRYFAIDPEESRLELLRSRHPWISVETGTIETVDSNRRFLHILLLRSFNHLPRPRAAIERAVELLMPGGTLLIVDDVAFGLVRSGEQRERAERSDAGFEHYRNASSEDALAMLGDLPLTLIERRDVDPVGSNQWLLRFAKREPER
jgi:2-polyprenyl-3-methyl-5-hydroxy-6-metoxy-1,4-benzoquinol methylase